MMNLKIYGEGASFTEYRKRPQQLTDLLPWALLIKPEIGITKYGAFFSILRYRGPDLDSSTRSELIVTRARLNNALRRLGTRWCLHFEAQRLATDSYPGGSFKDEVSALVDQERRLALRDKITHSYETEYYLTLTYLPPEDSISKAESLLYENAEEGSLEEAYQNELRYFEQTVLSIKNTMSGTMPFVETLKSDGIYTYLHNCISDRPHLVKAPETPMFMDAIISDTPFTGGLSPILGNKRLAMISVKGYPAKTIPLLLQELNALSFEYRWVSRYLPLDKRDAEKTITTVKRKWFSKRKGILTLIREAMVKEESRLEDSAALNKAIDADLALQALGEDQVSFGYFTPVIVLSDTDANALRAKVSEVTKILDGRGFVSVVESTNAVDAWLGTLPAHPFANCRRPPVSSLNMVDMMPLAGVWAGEETNEHYSKVAGVSVPALLLALTAGSTPFRFNLHQGDVGHTMLAGPTGAGKSAFLCFLAMQFRRYTGGKVIIFDREGSAQIATKLVGGQFFPIGSDNSGLSFQPLAEIDDMDERTWAHNWLIDLCSENGVEMTPERKTEIWDALTSLVSQPVSGRTLSVITALIQDTAMKEVLKQFVKGKGPHGDLLDANHAIEGSADWQCYETVAIFKRPKAIGPVLSYLFHRLDRQFTGQPTLLIIDEAWAALDHEQFRGKLEDWLRTLRRRNVSVVFANQDLKKIETSPISDVIIENCLTKIFLANRAANDPQTRPSYVKFGLNNRQIQLISEMTRQKEYYYQSRSGNRVFELGLSALAIAACASSSRNDLNEAERIETQYPAEEFAARWLDYKKIDSEYLKRLKNDLILTDGFHTVADDGGARIEILEDVDLEPDEELAA